MVEESVEMTDCNRHEFRKRRVLNRGIAVHLGSNDLKVTQIMRDICASSGNIIQVISPLSFIVKKV